MNLYHLMNFNDIWYIIYILLWFISLRSHKDTRERWTDHNWPTKKMGELKIGLSTYQPTNSYDEGAVSPLTSNNDIRWFKNQGKPWPCIPCIVARVNDIGEYWGLAESNMEPQTKMVPSKIFEDIDEVGMVPSLHPIQGEIHKATSYFFN